MLKERVEEYMRKYEAANDFDVQGGGKDWQIRVLRVKVNVLAEIIKEIVNWANKVENVEVLTKEK